MLPLWRLIPRTQSLFSKGLYSGSHAAQYVTNIVQVPGHTSTAGTNKVWKMRDDIVRIEGIQGEQREISMHEARMAMAEASEYQRHGPSIQGVQGTLNETSSSGSVDQSTHNLSKDDAHLPVLEGSHVSLHGCMQSTVPHPLHTSTSSSGYGSHMNMPGGGKKLMDKYVSGSNQFCHQSRNFGTSSVQEASRQGEQDNSFNEYEFLTDPNPQGVQGDNCVQFKLWMENCQRYSLPNCDEQLESLTTGRKTLAQVFQEQQEIIKQVVETYKKSEETPQMDSDTIAQGVQADFSYNYEFALNEPCPQGQQGDDCATYKAWAHNCRAFGFNDCNEKIHDIRHGRRTLQDVFDEQDVMIRKIVANVQQKRDDDKINEPEAEVGNATDTDSSPTNPHSTPPNNEIIGKLSQKDRLKRAVKEYGSTVVVFHIGISLISLGGFYLAVSR